VPSFPTYQAPTVQSTRDDYDLQRQALNEQALANQRDRDALQRSLQQQQDATQRNRLIFEQLALERTRAELEQNRVRLEQQFQAREAEVQRREAEVQRREAAALKPTAVTDAVGSAPALEQPAKAPTVSGDTGGAPAVASMRSRAERPAPVIMHSDAPARAVPAATGLSATMQALTNFFAY